MPGVPEVAVIRHLTCPRPCHRTPSSPRSTAVTRARPPAGNSYQILVYAGIDLTADEAEAHRISKRFRHRSMSGATPGPRPHPRCHGGVAAGAQDRGDDLTGNFTQRSAGTAIDAPAGRGWIIAHGDQYSAAEDQHALVFSVRTSAARFVHHIPEFV